MALCICRQLSTEQKRLLIKSKAPFSVSSGLPGGFVVRRTFIHIDFPTEEENAGCRVRARSEGNSPTPGSPPLTHAEQTERSHYSSTAYVSLHRVLRHTQVPSDSSPSHLATSFARAKMDSVSDPMLEIEAASSVISVLDVAQRFHGELKLLEIVVALHSVARHAEAAAFGVDIVRESEINWVSSDHRLVQLIAHLRHNAEYLDTPSQENVFHCPPDMALSGSRPPHLFEIHPIQNPDIDPATIRPDRPTDRPTNPTDRPTELDQTTRPTDQADQSDWPTDDWPDDRQF